MLDEYEPVIFNGALFHQKQSELLQPKIIAFVVLLFVSEKDRNMKKKLAEYYGKRFTPRSRIVLFIAIILFGILFAFRDCA
jgi:hypothetical protein